MIRNSSFTQNNTFYTGSTIKGSESLSTPMDYGGDNSNSQSGMDIDYSTTATAAPVSTSIHTNNDGPVSFGKIDSNTFTQEIQSHSKTVQALRKYLQRKLSTEGDIKIYAIS